MLETDGDAKPAPSRITTSAALRKTSAATGPRKTNILGAKKAQKLGVKKVTGDIIDFDEAEKKAKEEAERIEKLGYDPNAEEEVEAKKSTIGGKAESSTILSPTPVSPCAAATDRHTAARSQLSELERLGMGMGRLGFGQVGGNKPAAAAAPKKSGGGFGSVGPIKAAAEGLFYPYARWFRYDLVCSPVEQTTMRSMRAASLGTRKPSPQTNSSARALRSQCTG